MQAPSLQTVNQDRFWGVVLIGLGVVSIAFRPFDKVDQFLRGQADTALTGMLILLAIVAIVIALAGKPSFKALAIFWIVTP